MKATIWFVLHAAVLVSVQSNDSGHVKYESSKLFDKSGNFQGVVVTLIKAENCSRPVRKGDLVKIHFKATLVNNQEVESSYGGQPIEFTAGLGQVISGVDLGVLDMCVGDTRKLRIPPDYGYGEAAHGEKVPPRTVLFFTVELLGSTPGVGEAKKDDVFSKIDQDGDLMLSSEEVMIWLKKRSYKSKDEEALSEILAEIFEEEDKNKDGFIQLLEFSGPRSEL